MGLDGVGLRGLSEEADASKGVSIGATVNGSAPPASRPRRAGIPDAIRRRLISIEGSEKSRQDRCSKEPRTWTQDGSSRSHRFVPDGREQREDRVRPDHSLVCFGSATSTWVEGRFRELEGGSGRRGHPDRRRGEQRSSGSGEAGAGEELAGPLFPGKGRPSRLVTIPAGHGLAHPRVARPSLYTAAEGSPSFRSSG